MPPVRVLVVFGVSVFVGGALLAPWIYFLAQLAAGQFAGLEGLAHQPFPRYVNRSLLILALAGLWPFLRCLGIQSWREVGLVRPWHHRAAAARGFAVGFLALAIVALINLAAGARGLNLDRPAATCFKHLLGAALSAIVVALLEELVFRGAIFGGLRRSMRWQSALGISSLIYALVHFLQRPATPEHINWASGLVTLGQMLGGLTEWNKVMPAALNLMLAGLFLGFAYQRSGNLMFSIGLHAGWIFWLESFGFLTREVTGSNATLWGTGKLIDGWPVVPVLGVALLFFARRSSGQTSASWES